MPFYIHNPFTVMDADDVNDNMYYVADGSRIPYSQSTKGTLTSSDNTTGLGDSSTTWNTLYCGDVYNDSLTSSNRSLLHFIASETLADTATSIEFTGLNGDDYETMMIFAYCIGPTLSQLNIRLTYNQDSSTNYGYQYVRGISISVEAGRQVNWSSNSILIGYQDGTSPSVAFARHLLYTKTGHERTINSIINYGGNNTFVYAIGIYSGIYSNTTNTITSIKLENFFGVGMLTGTTIQLWGRK